MTDGSLFHRRYSNPPSSEDPEILEPIRRGLPEDIPGLVWKTPDFSSPGHKIIRAFDVSRKKRPRGEFIRCAICSGNHPKFLDGAVIWSPDEHLRLIGNDCAAKPEHFGVAGYRALQKVRKQEELDNVGLDWLTANAVRARSLVSNIQHWAAFARYLEVQRKAFSKGVPELAQTLGNRARRYGGNLTVTEELSGAQLVEVGGSIKQSRYQEVLVGVMQGGDFLTAPRIPRAKQFENNLFALSLIPDGEGDEPVLELMNGGHQRVTITAGAVFRSLQLALKLATECRSALSFFRSDNLSLLETWGNDERSGLRFTIRRSLSSVEFMLQDRSRAVLNTNSPQLPDLTQLEQIVSAGIQLDKLLPE